MKGSGFRVLRLFAGFLSLGRRVKGFVGFSFC